MIVLNILGYFGRNKQNSYAALSTFVFNKCSEKKYLRIYLWLRA